MLLAILLLACPQPADPPRPGEDVDPAPDGDTDTAPPEPEDADGDGSTADEDCDDADGSVHPGATERCNGVDDDCDGEVDEDLEETVQRFGHWSGPRFLPEPRDLKDRVLLDLDGDGTLDLAGCTEDTLEVALGPLDPETTFTSWPMVAPPWCAELLPADLDGDGRDELLVGLRRTGAATWEVWGLVADQLERLAALPIHTSSLAVGDLDGDGLLDLVTAREIFWNDGGAWSPATPPRRARGHRRPRHR